MITAAGEIVEFWEGDDNTRCGGVLRAKGDEIDDVAGVVIRTRTRSPAWEYVDAVMIAGPGCVLDDAEIDAETVLARIRPADDDDVPVLDEHPLAARGGDDGPADDDDDDDDRAYLMGAPVWLFAVMFYVAVALLLATACVRLADVAERRAEPERELRAAGVASATDRRRYAAALRARGLDTRAALSRMQPQAFELVDLGFKEGQRAGAGLVTRIGPGPNVF